MIGKLSTWLIAITAALLLCLIDTVAMGPSIKKKASLRETMAELTHDIPDDFPNKRKLQTTYLPDSCAEGIDGVDRRVLGGGTAVVYSPSFFQKCAENLVVNKTNMLRHLVSLDDIYEQYHCFYDLAKDPEKSEPMSYQPELGNFIVGQGGGAVDLQAGMKAIMLSVLFDGASMATFWEIQTLFNRLFDGHVALPSVPENFYNYFLLAFPERYTEVVMEPLFSFDDDNNLQLVMNYTNLLTGENEELTVETINGMSAHDFIIDMANNPAVSGLVQQSLGGRVNALLTTYKLQYESAGSGLVVQAQGKPLDVLPDSFEVTYTDGTSEMYTTLVLPMKPWSQWEQNVTVDGTTYFGVDAVSAEEFINTPGTQFDAFQRAQNNIIAAINDATELLDRIGDRELEGATATETIWAGTLNFTATLNESVAIFKLATFGAELDPDHLYQQWIALVETSKISGQTKLIIDLSSNPGGLVETAYLFLFLMFPNIDVDWFLNQWDMNWNRPMTEFLEGLTPVIVPLTEMFDVSNGNYTELFEESQARIDEFSQIDFEIFNFTVNAMSDSCVVDPSYPDQCDRIYSLRSNFTAFMESPDVSTYLYLISDLLFTVLDYNPFSANRIYFYGPLANNETIARMDEGLTTVIRGGVESNITSRLNMVAEDRLSYLKSLAPVDLPFDEYIFVSNGMSYSCGAIVPYAAAQLSKNRDLTGVLPEVRLLGYGGTGDISDSILSNVPASVEGVHLEDPIIGALALNMLVQILPSTAVPNWDEINVQVSQYLASVADPPFFGNTLPSMPTRNFYDINMDPGALPLQYIRIPLDEYIPKLYLDVSLTENGGLTEELVSLYYDVATFFRPPGE